MRKLKGFSLIELLVVLLIIGLSIGYVSLQVGDNSQQLRLEAKQFANNTALVAGEAVLGRTQLGIDLFRQPSESNQQGGYDVYGYRWLQRVKQERDEDTQSVTDEQSLWYWEPVAIPELEPEYYFSTGVTLQFDRGGEEIFIGDKMSKKNVQQSDKLRPDIYLLSSGEMTPFEIRLVAGEEGLVRHRIEGDLLGRIRLDKAEDDF